jgi:hypothetical protein
MLHDELFGSLTLNVISRSPIAALRKNYSTWTLAASDETGFAERQQYCQRIEAAPMA